MNIWKLTLVIVIILIVIAILVSLFAINIGVTVGEGFIDTVLSGIFGTGSESQ